MLLPPCPRCRQALPVDLVRVGEDLAPCPACGAEHRLSELAARADDALSAEQNRAEAAAEAPAGAWRHFEADRVRLGATHRSLSTALVMLGVALFWNGIVSVFVAFATVGTLRWFGVELPPIADQVKFEDGDSPGGGALIFLWLFLTPFIVIGAALILGFLNAVGGRTELCISPAGASLFSGIGPFGRTRRFDPATVRAVRLEDKVSANENGGHTTTTTLVIEREGAKDLRFGTSLNESRRGFILAALRDLLCRASSPSASRNLRSGASSPTR